MPDNVYHNMTKTPKCDKCGATLCPSYPNSLNYICPNCSYPVDMEHSLDLELAKQILGEEIEITSYSLTERGIEVDGYVDKLVTEKLRNADPQVVFDAIMDPEIDDFIDDNRNMEREDGEEDSY